MQTKILYLFTRTPLHVGAGASVGAIDQPVQRERHTGFPVVPGSSIKGVLADQYNATDENGKVVRDESRNATKRTEIGGRLFGLGAAKTNGDDGQAGAVCFGEAKLLAFPVRSAKGCFAWLTSPLCLMRWARAQEKQLKVPEIKKDNKAFFCGDSLGEVTTGNSTASVLLEDYVFHHAGNFNLAKDLAQSTCIDPVWQELAEKHLVLVSDSVLSHFAISNCEVAQHVVINDETGTAKEGLLFNQENVPSETLFFSALHGKTEDAFCQLTIPNPIQLGGDATTGLGFCTTNFGN